MMKVIQSDITTLPVDAIVNAANKVMLGGGGVDGAIHHAAGKELFNACLKVPEVRPGVRCPTGDARITLGFKLPAKFVIHTVGPVYRDGQHGEPEKLANCYRNSLALAASGKSASHSLSTISKASYGMVFRPCRFCLVCICTPWRHEVLFGLKTPMTKCARPRWMVYIEKGEKSCSSLKPSC